MGSSTATVVTRFAPSPTGFLHIGGARTALFNWLLARRHEGWFLLRIEDTDRQRSTEEAVQAIYDGLSWLGLDWDGEPVSQNARVDRHREIGNQLVETGHAYYCYASREELEAEGRPQRFESPWRERDPADAPAGVAPVLRFKAPREGETVIEDHVQGRVRVPNEELDDMVLLRSDGSPTYMLSVVVDDHDMAISHVLRGDDHLTNAFRQRRLFEALGWEPPEYAHIPLIHGPDGKKLSKRHGALSVSAYRDMGYLPEALRNYLLRLGWGHGDIEIIATEEAIRIFSLSDIGRGAARFATDKPTAFNGHYMREADDARLVGEALPFVEERLGRRACERERQRFEHAMPGLKARTKTLLELAESALFLFTARPIALTEKAQSLLDDQGRQALASVLPALEEVASWTPETLESAVRGKADEAGLKFKHIAQPMRAALTGSTVSPGIFDVLEALGREESLGRLKDQAS